MRRQRRELEKKLSRTVREELRKAAATMGKSLSLLMPGAPDVLGWLRLPGRKGKGREWKRVLQRISLRWFFKHLRESTTLKYGLLVVAPHEAYTTNTCPVCHRYYNGKLAKFKDRYRECPNSDCQSRQDGYVMHRELISNMNQPVATILQVRHLNAAQA